nr:MFS transporter [Salmonella enterica]
MSTYTRPVMLLLCGLLLLTLAIAVLNTLVPLWLAQANLPTWQVGMVSSSYFTGNLVGTLFTGYLIKRIGFNRSYYLASLIFAAGCVGLGTGNHTHQFGGYINSYWGDSNHTSFQPGGGAWTQAAGDHAHTVYIGGHEHTM